MEEIEKDDRFSSILKNPKFKGISKKERKIKIGKRFQHMFNDRKFGLNSTVDKRGKPVIQTNRENLEKFYNLLENESDSEISSLDNGISIKGKRKELERKNKVNNGQSDSEDVESNIEGSKELGEKKRKKKECKRAKVEKSSENNGDSEISVSNSEKDEKHSHLRRKAKENIKSVEKDLLLINARGEGPTISDSSSGDESESENDGEEEESDSKLEICEEEEVEETDSSTYRLAVCNMDWDHIRAVDIMMTFQSFLPRGGYIRSVTIYPSDFGLERMKEEEKIGPTELINNSKNGIDDNSDENVEIHMKRLRKYQLNRLKYYYAIAVFDSPETADKLYNELNNVEYESSGTKYNLRFVPDDMTFDQRPKEICDRLPDTSSYHPRIFTTTALQQTKVDLTWDETSAERLEIIGKLNTGDELNEEELKMILASGTSDEESDDPEQREASKQKLLAKEDEECEPRELKRNKKSVELECTWDSDFDDNNVEDEKVELNVHNSSDSENE